MKKLFTNKNRPKLKILPGKSDRILEFVGLVLLTAFWAFTFYFYQSAPGEVPMHFDTSGNPNRFGSKYELFFLSGLSTILYIFLSVLMRYPHTFNYLVEITEKNAEYQYRLGVTLIRVVKIIIVLVFFIITLFTYYSTFYGKLKYAILILPLIFLLTLVPMITILIKMLKK